MKKILIILICMIAMCFVACGETEYPPDKEGISLVIIAGRHANANLYTDDMLEEAEELMIRAFSYWSDAEMEKLYAQGKIYVIVSDGKPTSVPIVIDGKTDIEETLRCQTNTEGAREQKVEKMVAQVMQFLRSDSLKADDEEVDLLGAISEAKAILDWKPGAENHILILDTGISTTGLFNMKDIYIQEGTVEEVINQIPSGAFPSLTDIHITFLGLGNVAAPQQYSTDSEYQKRLQEVWTAIFEKCDATLEIPIKVVSSQGSPMMWYEDEDDGYPYVTTVVFKEPEQVVYVTPTVDEPIMENVPTPEPPVKEEIVTVFPSASLGFKGDSAEFRDEEVAKKVIGEGIGNIIKYLNAYPDKKVYVVGSIAKDTPTKECESHELSAARAEKVIDLLVSEHNIPKERLIMIDAGTTSFSWRNAVEYVDGIVNKANQQSNRVVAIIGEDADEVQELKKKGYVK